MTVPRKDNAMYYELQHFIELFESGKTESPINSFDITLRMLEIMDKAREQIGVKFLVD